MRIVASVLFVAAAFSAGATAQRLGQVEGPAPLSPLGEAIVDRPPILAPVQTAATPVARARRVSEGVATENPYVLVDGCTPEAALHDVAGSSDLFGDTVDANGASAATGFSRPRRPVFVAANPYFVSDDGIDGSDVEPVIAPSTGNPYESLPQNPYER